VSGPVCRLLPRGSLTGRPKARPDQLVVVVVVASDDEVGRLLWCRTKQVDIYIFVYFITSDMPLMLTKSYNQTKHKIITE